MSFDFANASKLAEGFNFIPFVIIFIFFYFVIIRPQNQKQKEQKDFVEKIKKGDKVITTFGVVAVVESVVDEVFLKIEISKDVCITISKEFVSPFNNDKIKIS